MVQDFPCLRAFLCYHYYYFHRKLYNMGSTAERKINASCLLQEVLLPPWVTSCQSMVTEKQWLVGRLSRALHHFMQSITSWALLLPGFSAVLTQIITFPPQNVVLLRFWKRRQIWWKPVRIQDNCSPGTGETAKTDQVRTFTSDVRGRSRQQAQNRCTTDQQCHSHSSWRVFQLCRCDHSWHRHWRPGPTSTCSSPQKQVLPLLLHGQEASSSVTLPPLGTFTHPLQPTEPCSPFHSCLLLLSKGHTSVATVPQLHELPSALHPSWGSVLLAESTVTLTIYWVFPNLTSLFWFITSPLNYFSGIMYPSNMHTNAL